MNYQKDAEDVLSLSWKYCDMVSCIQNQRPALLDDPIISHFMREINMANNIIEERVRVLAGEYE